MIKKLLRCFILIVMVIAIVVVTVLWQSYRFWLQTPAKDAQPIVFVVEEGSSVSSISKELHDQDLISNTFWFKVFTKLNGTARDLQAGEFELQKGMNYSSVIDILTNAKYTDVQITIPEGYTLAQIGEIVIQEFDISIQDWEEMTGLDSPLELHQFIIDAQKPNDVNLEGYLFPDTYRFFEDATVEDIVTELLETMEEKIEENTIKSPPGWALHDLITLASIIEREVRDPNEMAQVADIFLKRMEIGMALQADSTVNYITGKKTPGISLDDRDIDSPYNTYKYPGLPPGPISNPGLNALKAVSIPASNSYFYFLTTPEGDVIYATTHDQHVANKNQYLR